MQPPTCMDPQLGVDLRKLCYLLTSPLVVDSVTRHVARDIDVQHEVEYMLARQQDIVARFEGTLNQIGKAMEAREYGLGVLGIGWLV